MRRMICLSLVSLGAVCATASAATPVYPPPQKPTIQAKPKGPFHTLTVGKHGRYKTIQDAIDAAKAGDTVKVADGTYKGGALVSGKNKRYLKIVGDAAHPEKVVIEGKNVTGKAITRSGASMITNQDGIEVTGADNVTVNGFTAQHFRGNGFFFVNVNGYTATNLRAWSGGSYGVYAFNSTGGTITNSQAAWWNDSGYYVGQTPPQVKPVRTIVKGVQSWGNVLGFSGTNMRYVTITDSKFFDNGTGIAPNALHSEKYAPPEENVIADNDVFWNNFNYYVGAPFKVKPNNKDSAPYPAGVGILLFGSRTTVVRNNRIWGNYLGGAGMVKQLLLSQEPGAQDLIGNQFVDNQFGLNGTDLNGRDLFYDGDGTGNCFSGNTGAVTNVPADNSAFAACPFTGANLASADTDNTLVGWALASDHEANWIKHPHAPQAGLVPLEEYATYTGKKGP